MSSHVIYLNFNNIILVVLNQLSQNSIRCQQGQVLILTDAINFWVIYNIEQSQIYHQIYHFMLRNLTSLGIFLGLIHLALTCKFRRISVLADYLEDLQRDAGDAKTYQVAGVIIDKQGNIIQEKTNAIIGQLSSNDHLLLNPTNHGETRLIKWYWENKNKLNLPEPSQLTIVTTLDPCLMCGSNILISGFNVGVISNDVGGGVNYNNNSFADFQFSPEIRNKLLKTFGYYKIAGDQSRQNFRYDAENVKFKEQSIPKQMQNQIFHIFEQSSANVSAISKQSGPGLADLKDIGTLAHNDPLVQSLKSVFPDALSIRLEDKIIVEGKQSIFYYPSIELKNLLEGMVQNTPDAKNALAIIDPFGNLLAARPDRFDLSPIHTAVFMAVTDYAQFHFNQIDEELQKNPQIKYYKKTNAFNYMPVLSNCTFIFLNALPGDQLLTLQTVGIFGNSVSNQALKGRFIYINNYESESTKTLQSIASFLPPKYRQKMCPLHVQIEKESLNYLQRKAEERLKNQVSSLRKQLLRISGNQETKANAAHVQFRHSLRHTQHH